jgi:hypothetical protein
MKRFAFPLLAVLLTGVSVLAQQKTVTIATVNNPAMIELKKLSTKFEAENPDIKIELGGGGRKHPASTRDDRRFHRKRAVRPGFYRPV